MKKIYFANTTWNESPQLIENFIHQTPENLGVWGNITYTLNKDESDYIIVMDETTESVDPKKVIKTTPVIVKESVLGATEGNPVKKKKPYYRKKYNKPKPVEVVIPEPINNKNYFIQGLIIGVIVGIILTSIIETIIN
jgi:hypothetical protein